MDCQSPPAREVFNAVGAATKPKPKPGPGPAAMMDCDICHRGHDAQKLPFLCAVDARNSLYEGRMKILYAVLENEHLSKQVNDTSATNTKNSTNLSTVELSLAQQRMSEDRTDQILAAAERLREEIKAAREEIRGRKAALARRKADLAAVSDGLVQRRFKQQQELDKSAQVLRFRWAQAAEATANTRAFLCTEAIRLYGLRRAKKTSSGRYEYQLGKAPIIDPTAMDCMRIHPSSFCLPLFCLLHDYFSNA